MIDGQESYHRATPIPICYDDLLLSEKDTGKNKKADYRSKIQSEKSEKSISCPKLSLPLPILVAPINGL